MVSTSSRIHDLVHTAAKAYHVVDHAQVILVGGPVGLGKRHSRLKELASSHDHLADGAHVAHIVEKGEAPPDVDVHLGYHVLDNVPGIGPVTPQTGLPDQCLQEYVGHLLPENCCLFERTLPPVEEPDVPAGASVNLGGEQVHSLVVRSQGCLVMDAQPVLEIGLACIPHAG
jgi:hypothetical protein